MKSITNGHFDPAVMLRKARARAYPSAQRNQADEVAYWTQRLEQQRHAEPVDEGAVEAVPAAQQGRRA